MKKTPPSIWVVIPAAGIGTRMQSTQPKQYMQLGKQSVIEHTLDCFLQRNDIQGIVVGALAHDHQWHTLEQSILHRIKKNQQYPALYTSLGGETRSETVLNALHYLLSQHINSDDWVMVHDAARPCLRSQDIDRLIQQVTNSDACGGILASPVRDTMKRAQQTTDSHTTCIKHTESRDQLWHALTPQLFKLGMLKEALQEAKKAQHSITDEASAMELQGFSPLLIEGQISNIKITHPDDLSFAALLLSNPHHYE